MRSANPDLNRLLTFGERLDRWVQEAFMIPRETLERKRPEITAFIKGQLRANRALYDGFDRYRSIVERYVPGGGPGTDVLRPTSSSRGSISGRRTAACDARTWISCSASRDASA